MHQQHIADGPDRHGYEQFSLPEVDKGGRGDGYQLRPENGKCTSGYECFFSFKSGATATTLTVPSGITWTGADCNSGKEFAPLANTVYEVGIRCIGFASDGAPYLSARAGAC